MQGEKEWFTESIRNCQTGLYYVALGILKHEEDAKDAIQDALYKAYNKLDTLNDRKKFKPWIMKIVLNSSYEILRKRNYALDIDDLYNVESKEPDVNTEMTVWDMVQSLDLQYKTIVILFYYEDMSVKEISKITNLKPDAVKKRLSRARKQLKVLLSEEDAK